MNGLDIEPSARSSKKFGMCWGTYVEEGKRTGISFGKGLTQLLDDPLRGRDRQRKLR
jgi:hypothetical protein